MDEFDLMAGNVYLATSPEVPLQGMFRLLEIQSKIDWVTLIPIPETRVRGEGKQSYYYAAGFRRVRLSQLRSWLENKLVRSTQLELPSFWMMDDEQLSKRYLRTRKTSERPSALIRRDQKWALIEPIVPPPFGKGQHPPDLSYLDRLVKDRAKEAQVSTGHVYDALHRYYAMGCLINSLLPNQLGRCGNPGRQRLGSNGVKLGRKNAAAKNGDIAHQGLILKEEDIQNIHDAFQLIGPGLTATDAFNQLNSMFYSEGKELVHGVWVPKLLPQHLRPTWEEFMYRGQQGNDAVGAARRIMGDGAWLRKHRPLTGTSRDGIAVIAQTGSVDASPVDVHLVSFTNPSQPIGVSRGVFVRDIYSGLFLGWSLSINNPTAEDAKLAILRAAESKEKQLLKYRLDYPASDFPAIFFAKYHSDNGELRCKDSMITIADELQKGIEFIPSQRPDLNSSSESGHQSRHKTLDHKLPGTTYGRRRERGEKPPVVDAVLSRVSYMRLIFNWVHWYNVKKQLEISEIPAEMRRDFAARGEALPKNRLGVFRWAVANGYVINRPMQQDHLRAHLLPRFNASLRRDGIVLHRPGMGNAVELLHGARFNGGYLVESGMMRAALDRKVTHIEVRADPDDLSCVYIIDEHGIHLIPNILKDALLEKEGSISDLCSMNDEERLSKVYAASQVAQDNASMAAFRDETVRADRERQAAFSSNVREVSAQYTQTGIKAAQAQERRARLDSALPDDPPIVAPSRTDPGDQNIVASRGYMPQPTSLAQNRMNKILGFMKKKAP